MTAGTRALALLAALLLPSMPAAAQASDPHASQCPFEVPASAPPFTLPRAVGAIGAGAPLRILAIGSSSTAGFGASGSGQAYPAQLAGRLSAALAPRAVAVTNAGVSGETGPATLRRLEAAMAAPEPPQIVIWQVGTNDVLFGGTPAGLEALVVRGLDAVLSAGGVPIIVDQQYFRGILNLAHYEAFVAAVHRAAAARGAALLGRYAVMKHWALAAPGAFETIMALDRFHMGDRGYACLADLLAAGILANPPAASPQSSEPTPAPGRPPAGAAGR
ncbi:SGNH/GDSL hydrolase family protein [Xanthobacter sp. KR7-225]|uniref:SGNH/GDSL hydrolase family protein n=1 Tax=Xanthobacter sp. KR7-225 TaxID=3156613 RepID=UPI0032B5E4DE